MKKSYKSISFFVLVFLVLGCQNLSDKQEANADGTICCSKENAAIASFTNFTADPKFIDKHEAPLPMHYKSPDGEDITFSTPDGQEGKAFLVKSKKPSDKYLLMIHEWWGLNDYIKKEAEKYAAGLGNVNVMALDLYDGKVAATPDDAVKYMQSTTPERAGAIIKGAITRAGEKAKIATIGWCFGGGWSLQSALIAGKQAVACVMYYGMPEKDKEKLKSLNCDVLGIFASQDAFINGQIVSEFEKTMKEVGKGIEVKTYEADHAFANPSNPKYKKEFADDAYNRSVKFLKKRI